MKSAMLKSATLAALAAGLCASPAALGWEVLVENGDTLMVIAQRTRESDTTTVEQQALALLELNPHAFAKDNVNGLLSGTSLRVPNRDEAESVGQDEAELVLRAHHADWNSGVAVKSGDRLMTIAAETRESSTTTVEQQALALLRLNPKAFAKANINGLRWGTTLRVPGVRDAESVDADTASRIINEQHRSWQNGTAGTEAKSYGSALAAARPRAVTIIRGASVEVASLRN